MASKEELSLVRSAGGASFDADLTLKEDALSDYDKGAHIFIN